jgi:hypothetical protein
MQNFKKNIFRILLVLAGVYFLLLIPERDNRTIIKAADKPFVWNRDSVWNALEVEFSNAKTLNRSSLDSGKQLLFAKEFLLYKHIQENKITAAD